MPTLNGCSCSDVRNYSIEVSKKRMPEDWLCLACRGRQSGKKAGLSCSKCDIGLLKNDDYKSYEGNDYHSSWNTGKQKDQLLCTECYYDD